MPEESMVIAPVAAPSILSKVLLPYVILHLVLSAWKPYFDA